MDHFTILTSLAPIIGGILTVLAAFLRLRTTLLQRGTTQSPVAHRHDRTLSVRARSGCPDSAAVTRPVRQQTRQRPRTGRYRT
jgi:hypothetical protein